MKYNLSEITELIRDRRTIFPEQYSTRKVHKEQVDLILNNAIWAPTHGKTQPWRFHVFMDGGLQKLSNFLGKAYLEIVPKEEQNDMKLATLVSRPLRSSVVIAVSLDRQPTSKIIELEEIEAVSCAIQNMSLTCAAYGLGSFWSTPKIIYSEQMKNFLELKEEDKCLSLFYIGYPEGEWPKAQRRPIEYVTKWITE
ncbi:MAG: nitroreductase [Crocinitomicaceae bacterium]|nr:nitroreductase [Crocinitomicaceae bacterium]